PVASSPSAQRKARGLRPSAQREPVASSTSAQRKARGLRPSAQREPVASSTSAQRYVEVDAQRRGDEKGPDARKRGVARLRRTPVRRREWPDELTTQMGPYRRPAPTAG